MTTQLNFSASASPLSALVGAGLADAKAAPAAADAAGGSQFAELFTGHMLKLERQGIAAAQDAFSSLQVMPLGPGINVITSDAPVPDLQSLVAFAKAQGLDEAAVAGLFGDLPATARTADGVAAGALPLPAVQAPTLGLLQAVPGVSILGLEIAPKAASADALPAASTADVLASLGFSQGADGDQQVPAVAPADEAPAAAPMVDAMRLHMGIPGEDITRRLAQLAGMQGSVTWADLVAHAAAQQTRAVSDGTGVLPGEGDADAPGRTGPPRAAGSALGAGADAALAWAPVPAAPDTDAALALAVPPSAQAAARAPALPSRPTAQAAAPAPGRAPVPTVAAGSDAESVLAALAATKAAGALASATAQAAATADKLAAPLAMATTFGAHVALATGVVQLQPGVDAAAAQPPDEEDLVLDVPPGLDLADVSDHLGATAAEADGVPHTNRATGAPASAQSSADATRAAIQERAAQTQLLADRMGQAMANKLISQIERGQWKMQMRLQPGALGRVEVALDMHAGGLDAVFSTDNALTKELLGQGAGRLREALTQTGTTVASVTVNADARGQSGGNSTPQKRQPAPQQAAAALPLGATAARGGRYTAAVAEGLNVLA